MGPVGPAGQVNPAVAAEVGDLNQQFFFKGMSPAELRSKANDMLTKAQNAQDPQEVSQRTAVATNLLALSQLSPAQLQKFRQTNLKAFNAMKQAQGAAPPPPPVQKAQQQQQPQADPNTKVINPNSISSNAIKLYNDQNGTNYTAITEIPDIPPGQRNNFRQQAMNQMVQKGSKAGYTNFVMEKGWELPYGDMLEKSKATLKPQGNA